MTIKVKTIKIYYIINFFGSRGYIVYKNYKLKGLRAMRDIKQKNMAEILDITRESYVRKENGHSQFTLNEIKVIKDLFGMSVEEIFFD